ncbi:MAG: radical SAM family heme chaperone HemW [Acidimicrobiia bacterium]
MSIDRPDSAELADRAGGWASAYVHIPFCSRLCPYCDFAVVTGRDAEAGRYLEALEAEINTEPVWKALDSVYFGGGTPSLIEPSRLGQILLRLGQQFGINAGAEISLEANPEDWTAAKAFALREAGFTRVSFGAQSFEQRTLIALGRRHRPHQIEEAVATARAAGFPSVNLDLIYGSPSEGLPNWISSVDQAVALGLDHLSCYGLTVEPGTDLYRQVAAGGPAPDPDLQADQWEAANALATAAGLVRYEVSNWARPGHAVRYNLAVWAQADYLGFGLAAHRFRDGVRSHNFRHLDTYLESIEGSVSPIAGYERVSGWDRELERLFLGLRRAAGAVCGDGGDALLSSEEGKRLREAGVIASDRDRLVVRKPLLTDAAARAVLALSRPDC